MALRDNLRGTQGHPSFSDAILLAVTPESSLIDAQATAAASCNDFVVARILRICCSSIFSRVAGSPNLGIESPDVIKSGGPILTPT